MQKAFEHELVPTNVRSVDEWATLGYEARRKAGQRDRARLKRYLEANSFRSCDIADVLDSLGLVEPLAKTKPFFNIQALLQGSGLDAVAGGGALRSRLWPVHAL